MDSRDRKGGKGTCEEVFAKGETTSLQEFERGHTLKVQSRGASDLSIKYEEWERR